MSRSRRRVVPLLALLTVGGLTVGSLTAAPALARETTPVSDPVTALPQVRGPIVQTDDSYMFSTMAKARTPLDLAAHGFVEEEYFLSGEANVYEETGVPGAARVDQAALPYTNNIIVRRPADAADASGVVLVDILNASNGYPGEDHWRRTWDWCLDTGCTYIGLTSKPIQVDSLKHFDAERYADLSWDLPDAEPREPITADVDNPESFNPFQTIPGTEEGFVWDITTQLGNLLENDPGAILGDVQPETTILAGQSQSGVYLNTYTTYFDALLAEVNDEPVWDAYLNTVGGSLVRGLRQDDSASSLVTAPNVEPVLSVPMITIDSEADFGLFGEEGLGQQPAQPLRRHWQVPSSPHTWSASPVIPTNEELVKAGRLPRAEVTPEYLRAQNPFPLEPTVLAAIEALDSWARDGEAAAPSAYFEIEDEALVRDERGNALGGVRYGLNRLPLGTIAITRAGDMNGTVDVLSREEFRAAYGTRDAYLARLDEALDEDIEAGYLTEFGKPQFLERAGWLLDRIEAGEGEQSAGDIPVTAEIPGAGGGDGEGPGENPLPGALALTVSEGGLHLDGARHAGDRLRLGGVLPAVSVTDSRAQSEGWAVTGQASDLSAATSAGAATVQAGHLGWAPFLVDGQAQPGGVVASVLSGGAGLAAPATLGTSGAAGAAGTASLAADVELEVPVTTRAGSYTGAVTISLFPQD